MGGCEDLWEGADGSRWVGDAVVEDDDGAGGQIFFDQPADVARGRVHRVVWVSGTEDALVAMSLGETELAGAGNAAGRTEELWRSGEADGLLGLLEVVEEYGIGMVEERAVGEVVIGDFVAGGFDAGDEAGMAEGALANEEERCVGVVLLENVEDLRREDGVRAVIEGKRDQGMTGADTVGEIWRDSLQKGKDGERLGPEQDECDGEQSQEGGK